MFIRKMEGQECIDNTRKYLDYLEEHLNNIAKAFQEVSEACDGMAWVGDDYTWHSLRREVEMHDLSKFSKEEFTQYRDKFFTSFEEFADKDSINLEFDKAWDNHKKENHHHWETATTEDDIVHMIVDWTAMGYKFGDTAQKYYEANMDDIKVDKKHLPFMYEIFKRISNGC